MQLSQWRSSGHFLNVDGQQVFNKTEWSQTHALAFGLYEAA